MSFFTALTGLKGAQTDISTTSNNIANVGSNGFKKSRASNRSKNRLKRSMDNRKFRKKKK